MKKSIINCFDIFVTVNKCHKKINVTFITFTLRETKVTKKIRNIAYFNFKILNRLIIHMYM